jgi:pyruvate, water dikinase
MFNLINFISLSICTFCLDDLPKVGGKTASLGELIQQLTPLGVAVPGGFAVSSTAYDAVLDQDNLRERLNDLLKDLDGKQII